MDLLERLTLTPGIAGREQRIRDLILSVTKGIFDETRVDPMGSLIGVRRPRPAGKNGGHAKPLKVMLAAHMDQIGFMVRHVDDKGFLRVHAVGGFDTRNLFARLVTVCTSDHPSGDLLGVLNPSGRPIHIATDEEKKKIPEVNDLMVDLGMPADEVKRKVKIGDMVVIQAPYMQVGNTLVAQALDNRVACWIVIRALQELAHHDCEVHCVFTVQEEVGLRGAATAAFGVTPDVGIAVDTTLCVDIPGVPEDQCVTRQGEGAALTVMDSASICDPQLLEEFEAVARKQKIKVQRSILPRGGTDAGAIQRAGIGVRSFTLSCPTRYIHSVTEMIHMDDLQACRQLLTGYLAQAK